MDVFPTVLLPPGGGCGTEVLDHQWHPVRKARHQLEFSPHCLDVAAKRGQAVRIGFRWTNATNDEFDQAGQALGLLAMAQRVGIQSDVVMSGGVSRNIGIIRTMEAKLGKRVLVPAEPQSLGALGAALFAREGGAAC